MKKVLILIATALVMAVSFDTHAQSVLHLKSSTGNDTVSASATTYFSGRVVGSGKVVVKIKLTKVSGTVGGYAVLQGSSDDLWNPGGYNDISTDSLIMANSDNSKQWDISNDYLHYRVKLVTNSGTQVLAAKGFAGTK